MTHFGKKYSYYKQSDFYVVSLLTVVQLPSKLVPGLSSAYCNCRQSGIPQGATVQS